MRVEDMPAGPEMDAWVAEQVMGWHLDDTGMLWCNAEGTFLQRKSYSDFLDPALQHGAWVPSRDIAAAWQVDKKGWIWQFREQPWGLQATLYPSLEIWGKQQEMYPLIPAEVLDTEILWPYIKGNRIAAYCLARCRLALIVCDVTEVPNTLEKNREILHGDRSGEI